MDNEKVGRLIFNLRMERGMTQKRLADSIGVSDKAVSKWERGLGCPDVSLLPQLSEVLGVDLKNLLSGELDPNNTDGGNMKRTKFYVCPECGCLLTATGGAEISCCGRRLEPMKAVDADSEHSVKIQEVEDDYYITFDHPMSKEHFIRFAAYVSYDRVLTVRLYPEQGSELRIPQLRGGQLYICCSQHGLMKV